MKAAETPTRQDFFAPFLVALEERAWDLNAQELNYGVGGFWGWLQIMDGEGIKTEEIPFVLAVFFVRLNLFGCSVRT